MDRDYFDEVRCLLWEWQEADGLSAEQAEEKLDELKGYLEE